MNCPFCESFLKSIGPICPTCKSSLPKVELIPIYKKILVEQRELGKPENRSKLDEIAIQEYQVRLHLTEVARKEESERLRILEIEKEESLRKLNEEKAQKAEVQKQKRAKSNKVIGKVLIVTLVILSILGTGKLTLNIFENRKVAQDCLILNTPLNNSGVDKVGIPVDIANLSFLIKSYPYSPYFDFDSADSYLQERNSIFASQTYQSAEITVFAEKYRQNASKMSELLQKGRIGQAIGDIKQGKGSLQDLATQQIALFNSNPCFDEVTERENVVEGLSTGSKKRSDFSSKFLIPTIIVKPTAKPKTETTAKPKTEPTAKPKTEPTAKPARNYASATLYLKQFIALSMNCSFIDYVSPVDAYAKCYSPEISKYDRMDSRFEVGTGPGNVRPEYCQLNTYTLPVLTGVEAQFINSEARFTISSYYSPDKLWLNNAAQIVMNTFGAKLCSKR